MRTGILLVCRNLLRYGGSLNSSFNQAESMMKPGAADDSLAKYFHITKDSIYRCMRPELFAQNIGTVWKFKLSEEDACLGQRCRHRRWSIS